jgi:hypothetical protein
VKDFIFYWVRGFAVCVAAATFADIVIAVMDMDALELWAQALFVTGVPTVSAVASMAMEAIFDHM